MTEPSGAPTPDELYEDRGDVSIAVPLMQGDVLTGVSVPGLADEALMVMIAAHPCTMRRGAKLADRIAVLPIEKADRVTDSTWSGHVNFMLLPDLLIDNDDYRADFRRISSVPSQNLPLNKRIATLSADGVILFQQRLIRSLTRFVVPHESLEQQMAPTFTEMELQRDWVESALESIERKGSEWGSDAVDRAISSFHDWLDENQRERRNRLGKTQHHAALRREARQEARLRFE